MKHLIIITAFVLAIANSIYSQDEKRFDFSIRAGLNIGAAAPASIPQEIRAIEGYSPNFNGSVAGRVAMRMGHETSRWHLVSGISVERKSMTTSARVKSYSTEIDNGGSHVGGVWTGMVDTRYSAHAITVPLMAGFVVTPRLRLQAGVWASALVSRAFGGKVYDGYLREGDPTGEKIVFANGSEAEYEFDDQLRSLQCGLMAGVEYRFCQHWLIGAELSYGLTNIFHADFKTVSFAMYPIFGNLSIGYRL
ncbi:MAG: PorT family protein [Bacteroidales bacterium]|nr:PorT family protein [Bacteroidales bacterium]